MNSEKKRKLPTFLKVIFAILGWFAAMVAASMILEHNSNSVIGILLMLIATFLLIGGAIYGIVKALRKIAARTIDKHRLPKEVTVTDIDPYGVVAKKHFDKPVQGEGGEVSKDTKPAPGDNGFKRTYTYNRKEPALFQNGETSFTWAGVVLTIVVLFPLGVVYLLIKVTHEKTLYYYNGVKMAVIGATFSIITAPIILLFLIRGRENIAPMIAVSAIPGAYFLLGVAMLTWGLSLKRRGDENEAYARIIITDKITNIDEIAKLRKTTYSRATAVINRLIDSNILKGAYIYHRDREVIVPGVSKKVAIYCKNCGGTTVIYINEAHKCAYCGAMI